MLQGVNLGVLLISIYINGMEMSISCKLLLYEDDSALLMSHKDPHFICKELGNQLETVGNVHT